MLDDRTSVAEFLQAAIAALFEQQRHAFQICITRINRVQKCRSGYRIVKIFCDVRNDVLQIFVAAGVTLIL